MKIVIDDIYVIELSEAQEKVIKSYILEDEFQEDMIRRVKDAVEGKYLNCFKRLKDQWDIKLEEHGVEMIPTNKEEYAKLVFAHPDYESRSQRETSEKNRQEKEKADKEKTEKELRDASKS